jgi:SAM-dependent methyltransferase
VSLSPDDRRRALDAYLAARPFAFALWRYSEVLALADLEWHGRILDLGCGDGLFGEHLFSGADVVGLDADAAALEQARRRRVYRELVRHDIHTVPFGAGTFDAVFANCVLEHVDDPGRVLAEAARVLRPGGRFVFTVPSQQFARWLLLTRLLDRAGLAGPAAAYGHVANRVLGHRHLLAEDAWRSLALEAGFSQVEFRPYAGGRVPQAFDLTAPAAVPAIIAHRLTGKWWVVPKGRVAAALVHWLSDDAVRDSAGLVSVARR